MEASCSDVNIPLQEKSDECNYIEDDDFESLDVSEASFFSFLHYCFNVSTSFSTICIVNSI